MSKTKIILAAIGGSCALVSLVLCFLIWSAASDRSEKADEIEDSSGMGMMDSARKLMRQPIYPGPASVRALESNRTEYASWSASARTLAARGDCAFEATTAPAFKTFLVEEARHLSELPGGVDGKLVKPEFPFGFKDYIIGGKMPEEADLPRLQREWNDVSTVISALAVTGVVEIVDVTMKAKAEEPEPQETGRRNRRRKAPKADEAAAENAPLVTTFTVVFRARPQGLVSAVNAIVASSRFIVIDDMSFVREQDALSEILGGDAKGESAAPRRSSRRRRGAVQDEESAGEAKGLVPGGLVTDPARAPLLKVSMSFSVYDFRSRTNDGKEVEK